MSKLEDITIGCMISFLLPSYDVVLNRRLGNDGLLWRCIWNRYPDNWNQYNI